MGYSAKLFGWIAITTLMVSAVQLPVFSEEDRGRQAEAVQTKQVEESAAVLLEVEGVLEEGDNVLGDGSLYDPYTIEGKAGQTIAITLESPEFDTFLLFSDRQGNELARNDDIDTEAGNYNSFIIVTLPTDGTYQIWVNGLNETSQGSYVLTVVETTPEQAVPRLSSASTIQIEANRLLQQGLQQNRVSQFREALQSWEQALTIYREIGDRTGEAKALNNIGLVNDSLGNYPTALEYSEQSLVITREINDRATEAQTLNNIGNVNQSLGNYPTALENYEQSLVIKREIGDRAGEAGTLNNIGIVNQSLGNYPTALENYEQSLVITREIGDRATEAATLTNIGIVNDSLGNYPTALDYYEQSLVITREIGDRTGEAATLNNIGEVNRSLGNYPTALDYYEQSLVITREIGDRTGEAATLNNIGEVNRSLGNYPTALEYSEQSLVITRETGDQATEAQTLNNIGNVNQSLGNYPTALDSYEQSLVITRETGDRATEAATLNNIGAVNRLLGNYPTALENYEQSLVITREIGDRAGEAGTLNNIGIVNQSLGNYPTALENYEQSLVITREIGDRATEAATLNNTGLTYLSDQDARAAEIALTSAVDLLDTLRSTDLSDADKISLFETQQSTFRLLQQALVAQDKYALALSIAERGRARAFTELLAERLNSDAAVADVQSLDVAATQSFAQQQQTTLVQYSVINYQELDPVLYIWIVSPQGEITFRQEPLANIDLTSLVTDTRQAINVRGDRNAPIPTYSPEVLAQLQAEQDENLAQLHDLLIEPIADLLPTDPNQPIVFIPQDELFLVPFPALKDDNGNYLIENHTILTAPSIQVLQLTHDIAASRDAATLDQPVIVGNPAMPTVTFRTEDSSYVDIQLPPLYHALKEANAVSEFLGTSALTGDQATEATVKQQIANADLSLFNDSRQR